MVCKGLTILALLVGLFSSLHGFPEGLHASQNKLMKLKEKERSKDVVIVQKTSINDDNPHSGLSGSSSSFSEGSESSSGSGSGNEESGPGNGNYACPTFYPTKEHAEFLSDMLLHRVHVLMGSTNSINSLSRAVAGVEYENSNQQNSCFRSLHSVRDSRLYGFDSLYKPESCNVQDPLDVTCHAEYLETDVKEYRRTAIWSDGHQYALILVCEGGEQGGWQLVSSGRKLDAHVRDQVLERVVGYGFDQNDHIEIQWSSCQRYYSEEAAEGACDSQVHGIDTTKINREKVMAVLSEGVYTPFISTMNVHAQSRFLRGITLKDDEINHLCRKDYWTDEGLTMHGFDNYTGVLNCDTEDLGYITCRPDEAASSNKHIMIYNMKMSVVWTDSVKYVLFVNCLSNNLRTWVLYSTDKHVDQPTRLFVLDRIEMWGFNRKKSHVVPYHSCRNVRK